MKELKNKASDRKEGSEKGKMRNLRNFQCKVDYILNMKVFACDDN